MSKSPDGAIHFTSYTMPQDVKEDILSMREEGLSYTNIAWYLGVNVTAVRNVCRRDIVNARKREWYRNLSKIRLQKERAKMREYYWRNKQNHA